MTALRRLVEDARLSPRDALWSATVGPAQFARLDYKLGTLSMGKIADLVLLDADPLADIRNTRRIFAVVQAGRFFSRVNLDALLDQARSARSTAADVRAQPSMHCCEHAGRKVTERRAFTIASGLRFQKSMICRGENLDRQSLVALHRTLEIRG